VLGCVLLAPHESLGLCIERLKTGVEVFYDLRHRLLYELLVGMLEAKEPIDLLTVQQRLKDRNQLDGAGGVAYLSSLCDAVPSAANLGFYAGHHVREKHLLRSMIQTCTNVITRVQAHEGEVDQLLDEVERDVLRISEERVEANTRTIKDLVRRAIVTIEEFHQRQGMLTGLSTGFPDLDKMTTGLHGGEMIVIAARPSVGKTSLAMNICRACGGGFASAGGGVQFGDDGGIAGIAHVVFAVAGEPAECAGGIPGGAGFSEADRHGGQAGERALVH
jgi:replicative DNA helicase